MSWISSYWRQRQVKLRDAKLRRGFDPRHQLRYNLAPYVKLNRFEIGDHSYGNPKIRTMWSDTRLIVGKYCSFAEDVQFILGGNHHLDYATTFPLSRLAGVEVYEQPSSRGDIVIGSDVWIGTEATILSGVKIGHGAIVGACAVVARDVPPYTIVVGNPARATRKRFGDEVIAELLELQWWDLTDAQVNGLKPLLESPNVAELLAACRKLRTAAR